MTGLGRRCLEPLWAALPPLARGALPRPHQAAAPARPRPRLPEPRAAAPRLVPLPPLSTLVTVLVVWILTWMLAFAAPRTRAMAVQMFKLTGL